jgi:hypothetical protein
VFGGLALMMGGLDLRVILRGGVTGAARVARHLWRMCFALFIAASSIFLARQQLFPAFMRKTGALVFLSFLPLLLMIFWVIRVHFKNAYKITAQPHRTLVAGGALPAIVAGMSQS